MPKPQRPTPTRQDSDYDGAWKEFLRRFIRPVIAIYFPDLYALINWHFAPEWLDKEISQILAKEGRRNGRVDLLFKVRLLDGDVRWILFHLEIQSSREPDFAFRMACYNGGILWAFRERVITLAILADLDENWIPSEDTFTLGSFESKLKFPVCKLIKRLEEWKNDHSLPVVFARAQIAALQTASDPEARYAAKWQLIRNLYSAGNSKEELREAFRLIDWMLKLQQRLSDRFNEELKKYEEEIEMPFVPSFERKALAQGKKEGRKEGEKKGVYSAVVRCVEKKFGALATADRERLKQLTLQQLNDLTTALFDFESDSDFAKWLDEALGDHQ